MTWDWVKDLNLLSYQGVWRTRGWVAAIAVALVIAVYCTMTGKSAPDTFMGIIFGALATWSGVGHYSQKVMRETDWELNRIKAGANVAGPATVVEAGGTLNTGAAPAAPAVAVTVQPPPAAEPATPERAP